MLLRAGAADDRFAAPSFLFSYSQSGNHVVKNAARSFDRSLWKAAGQIHDRLKTQEPFPNSLPEAKYSWLRWQQFHREMEIARGRGWPGAMKHLRESACQTLQELIALLEADRNLLDPDRRRPVVWSTAEIYRECLALKDEFSEIECDLRTKTLSAVTESITLEEVELGAFEIRLSWSSVDPGLSYEVIAVDPHPCANSDEVTHPHVESNVLCAGDGRYAIKSALEQGRLFDFFLVVRQVLDTYNPGSAYVELASWYGQTCPDCGADVCDDDLYTCEDCETSICGDCFRVCMQCDIHLCGDCGTHCASCQEPTCRHCLTNCSECKAFICKGCLNNENDKTCKECLEKREEETSAPPETEAEADSADVHAVCVGQTVVPA